MSWLGVQRQGWLGVGRGVKPSAADVISYTTGMLGHFAARLESYADGASVPTWNDQSGNGSDLTQGTGANQFVFKTGGQGNKPYMLAASGRWMRFTSAGAGDLGAHMSGSDQAATIAAVVEEDTAAAYRRIAGWWRNADVTPICGFGQDSSNQRFADKRDDAGGLASATGSAVASAAFKVWIARWNGTTFDLFINGVKDINASALDVGTITVDEFLVSAARHSAYAENWLNKMYEVIVYDHAVNDANVATIDSDLATIYAR